MVDSWIPRPLSMTLEEIPSFSRIAVEWYRKFKPEYGPVVLLSRKGCIKCGGKGFTSDSKSCICLEAVILFKRKEKK